MRRLLGQFRGFGHRSPFNARVVEPELFANIKRSPEYAQTPFHDQIPGPLNVFKQPLAFFSDQPPTGFHRDGYCRTGVADVGNHAVAGVVTEEFLDFSASRGNDLRLVGVTARCKWCLCTLRWLEAFQAYKNGEISENGVPKVHLNATEDSALNRVDMETLKQFAVDAESNSVNGADGS